MDKHEEGSESLALLVWNLSLTKEIKKYMMNGDKEYDDEGNGIQQRGRVHQRAGKEEGDHDHIDDLEIIAGK